MAQPAQKIDANYEFPEKFDFLFSPCRYKVAYGGRGGAKSWAFARALLLTALQRKAKVLCARELQNSIAESVHALLSEQIESMGLGGFYRITQTNIYGLNGSEFFFAGLKTDPNKIKSAEGIDIVWVEEAESVSKASWAALIPTIRKKGSEIWVTFNPALETDATYQMFVVSPPAGASVVSVSWRDNPWFGEELENERKHLESVDHDAYLHIWEGFCRRAGDNQLIGLSEAVEATKRVYTLRDVDHAPKIIGVDVARYGSDRSCIVIRHGLICMEPLSFRGMNNMAVADQVMLQIEKHHPDAVFIDGGRGEGVIDRLRQCGHSVMEVNFGGSPLNDKYQNKRAEMWDSMAEWVKGKGQLPSNNDLLNDLAAPTYVYSNTTNKFQLESKEMIKHRTGRSPDLADALALTFAAPVVKVGVKHEITANNKYRVMR